MARLSYSPSVLKSLNSERFTPNNEIMYKLNVLHSYCKKKPDEVAVPGDFYQGTFLLVREIDLSTCYSFPRLPPVLISLQQAPLPQVNHTKTTTNLPGFFLTNTRSALNKTDELEVLLNQNNICSIDIAVLTETWQSDKISDEYLSVGGFNVLTGKRGGGVAVYVRDNIPVTTLNDVNVPDELECIWLYVRPHRLPRKVTAIVYVQCIFRLNLNINRYWLIYPL